MLSGVTLGAISGPDGSGVYDIQLVRICSPIVGCRRRPNGLLFGHRQ